MRNGRRLGTLLVALSISVIFVALCLLMGIKSCGTNTNALDSEEIQTSIQSIREVLRLTSVEGERSVPVTYSFGQMSAFGVGNYRYRISYNIDSLKSYNSGDSLLIIRLPHEDIRILEDEHQGFRVIDVWGNTFFSRLFGSELTTAKENEMKRMATTQLEKLLKADGTVDKARAQALEMVGEMFSLSRIGGRVVVLPPLPKGVTSDSALNLYEAKPIAMPTNNKN